MVRIIGIVVVAMRMVDVGRSRRRRMRIRRIVWMAVSVIACSGSGTRLLLPNILQRLSLVASSLLVDYLFRLIRFSFPTRR